MKTFQMDKIFDAYEHAKGGGQALHLHTINQGHPPSMFKHEDK